MRNVEFQEVGMKNYGPYIDPMVLEFKNDTLTLMTGPNGIGKTMSLDAIPFTLYGITSKKAKGDDVVNNKVGKNCKTWVKFKINDTQYIVTRYHKYSKLGNTVILNENGVDTKKGHREVVPEVERLVCSQKAFMNTLMFGQKVKDFFTDLVDSDKKEIFRKILGLEQYEVYYKQVTEDLKTFDDIKLEVQRKIDLNTGLIEDAKQQIAFLEEQKKNFYIEKDEDIKKLQESITINERLLKKWKDQIDNLTVDELDLTRIEKELSTLEIQIDKLQDQIDSEVKDMIQKKDAKISEIKQQASEAQITLQTEVSKKIEKLQKDKEDISKKLQDIINDIQAKKNKKENEAIAIYTEAQNARSWADEIKASLRKLDGKCPTCDQEVSEEAKNNLVEKIKSYEIKIAENVQKEKILTDEAKALSRELIQIAERENQKIAAIENEKRMIKADEKDQLQSIQTRLQDASKQIEKIAVAQRNEIEKTRQEEIQQLIKKQVDLAELKEKAEKVAQEIKNIEETVQQIERQIDRDKNKISETEIKEYDEAQLISYKKKIKDLKLQISMDADQIKSIDSDIEILKFWKVGFSSSGIPSMLIDEAIPFMNSKVSEYLDMITNGRYIVSFDTLGETKSGEFRDKISVRVIDTHTKGNSRVQLSGGQTRIIDIATILTLGDLQSTINDVKFNILLFDEIFDALDYENVGYVSKVLNKIKKGKSIVIISHQNQEQLENDEHLSFT
jgi:exonuclease SbcC